MSQGLIVRCPSCAARLRLPGGPQLAERFKVRCSECGKPFVVRRKVAADPPAGGTPREDTLAAPRVAPPSGPVALDDEVTRRTSVGAPPPVAPGGAQPPDASAPRSPAAPREPAAVAPVTVAAAPPLAGQPAGRESLLPWPAGASAAGSLGRGAGRDGRAFSPGELVAGRYRVERFLAQGGMGEVYEAYDQALGELVALKTVRPDVAADELALERFKREIQLARQVTHRNVCRIHDFGTHRSSAADAAYAAGEIPFVSMELLRGETLAERLARNGPLGEEEALPLARQMAAALDAAHAVGIVHRDFKCSNVVLEPDMQKSGRVVVTDFGLARGGQGAETAATLTVAGAVMGSPGYMAPEQVEGGKVTPAVDVYALGVVLFEMLTGVLPFKGESPLATAVKRLTEAPPAPSSLRAGISPRWEEAVLRCLARRPEERFQRAADVVAALDPQAPASVAPAPAPASRRRLWLAVAAGFLLAAALAVNFVVWRDRAARGDGVLEAPSRVRRSVALLALQNVTGDQGLAWLSHGLPEMLSSELAAGGAVRIVPGENVSRAQRELGLEPGATWGSETLERVRRNLGSDYLVTGAFTALGGAQGQLRLDLRLQDTLNGANSTAVAVNGRREALFDLVAEAGARLREALDVRGEGAAWRSADPEATRLYSEGLEKLRGFDAQGARRLFEQGVTEDPDDARLQSALATSLASLGYVGQARQAAQRAVELSAPLAESERQEIRARYLAVSGDWPGAAAAWDELWRAFPDNLEYGLELAGARIAAGDPQAALEVTSALRRLPSVAAGDLRIHVVEAAAAGALGDSRRQQQAAHEAAAAAQAQGARLQRAVALLQEGWALRNLGQPGRAASITAEAETLFAQAGDGPGVARARVQRASLLYDEGKLEAARELFEGALATSREIGDKGGQAQALNNLAVVVKQQGQTERALELYVESRRISQEAGSDVGVANAENNIGTIQLRRGDLAGAQASFGRALELARRVGDRNLQAYALHNLAGTLRRQGRLADAEARHGEALELRRAIGQRVGETASRIELAAVHADRGGLAAARQGYESGLALARETGNRRFEASALAGLAGVRFAAGELEEAERLHREALALREELGEEATAAESRLHLALVLLEQGRFAEAEEHARGAEERLAAEEFTDLVSLARAARGRALAALRRPDEAREAARLAGESAAGSQDLRLRCEVGLARARVAAAAGRLDEARGLAEEAASAAEPAGLRLQQLDARLLLGQLARLAGDEAEGARLIADARARAERAGLGLVTRRAGAGG